jgi:hypothetical protein
METETDAAAAQAAFNCVSELFRQRIHVYVLHCMAPAYTVLYEFCSRRHLVSCGWRVAGAAFSSTPSKTAWLMLVHYPEMMPVCVPHVLGRHEVDFLPGSREDLPAVVVEQNHVGLPKCVAELPLSRFGFCC